MCRPLFVGKSDLDQLGSIFNLLGTPICTSDDYDIFRLPPPHWNKRTISRSDFPPCSMQDVRSVFFSGQDEQALNLLLAMLELDHEKRITVTQALQHPYFNMN